MNFEISICIITYNRGARALENVENILAHIKNSWCVLVLDNGSNLGTEDYQKIENLAKINKQLFYVRHETNLQVHGNFRSCFDYANSKYIMVLSDEDFVDFNGLESILVELNHHKKVGACRPSISPHKDLKIAGNSNIYPDKYLLAGNSALNGFSFVGNYISGIIYNLELIKKTNLLKILDKNIISYRAYPHLYFDLLVSSLFDVIITSKVAVFERQAEETLIENGSSNVSAAHIGLYGYGERVNQFLSFRDAISDAINLMEFENNTKKMELFINLYLKLVSKYFFLIFQANISNYVNNKMEIDSLKESFFYITCSAILKHPNIGTYQEQVLDHLIKIYQNFKNK
jgi:glycosyltransferase involved in cell wall biosynthesis